MMALISDIHGNYTALKAVLDEIDKMSIDTVYCLGDVVGYYTQINECCNEIRRRSIKTVMGNHDWYMVAGSFCPRSNSVNDCLKFQKQIITEENLTWLSKLPVHLKLGDLSILHGGWGDPIDEYVDPSEDYFSKVDGKYFASGHTHRQTIKQFQNKIYCNPGSVGQPRDNDPRAAFATFDGTKFDLYRVDYDIDEVCKLMEKAGFSGYYYDCLKSGASRLGWEKRQ
jgi:predicted phosphodiesterase